MPHSLIRFEHSPIGPVSLTAQFGPTPKPSLVVAEMPAREQRLVIDPDIPYASALQLGDTLTGVDHGIVSNSKITNLFIPRGPWSITQNQAQNQETTLSRSPRTCQTIVNPDEVVARLQQGSPKINWSLRYRNTSGIQRYCLSVEAINPKRALELSISQPLSPGTISMSLTREGEDGLSQIVYNRAEPTVPGGQRKQQLIDKICYRDGEVSVTLQADEITLRLDHPNGRRLTLTAKPDTIQTTFWPDKNELREYVRFVYPPRNPADSQRLKACQPFLNFACIEDTPQAALYLDPVCFSLTPHSVIGGIPRDDPPEMRIDWQIIPPLTDSNVEGSQPVTFNSPILSLTCS